MRNERQNRHDRVKGADEDEDDKEDLPVIPIAALR